MKKLIPILLALALLFSFAACGTTEQNDANTPNVSEEDTDPTPVLEDPETVNLVLWANGAPPTGDALALVNEAINAITLPELNVEVNIQFYDIGTYIGTIATSVGAGDDIDLMCTFPAAAPHFSSMSAQGMLMPIDDLLQEHGQGILDLIPADWWGATTKNDEILSVPLYANKSLDYGIMFVKEWFDETGYKVEDVKTIDDIYNVLKAFKEKHPDKIAISGAAKTLDFSYLGYEFISNQYYDTLGDTSAIAAIVPFTSAGQSDYQVVSRYESDDFQALRKILQQWYNEGLVDKDVATNDTSGFILQAKDNVFAAMSVFAPSTQAVRNASTLQECYYIKLMNGTLATSGLTQMTWALPVTCDVPEAAMKLLNMMYTDSRLVNLINFGKEGVHYNLDAQGQMVMPEGVTPETSEYYPNCFNFVTNTIIGNTWAGTDPTLPQQEEAAIHNSIVSPLLGFSFNTSNVEDIYALLGPMCKDEYGPALFTGAASDQYYDEFISKLYSAGLQTYIDELQSQVDAWVAANK